MALAVSLHAHIQDSFKFESGKFEIINLAEKGGLDKAGYALLSPSEVSRSRQSDSQNEMLIER